MHACVYYSMAPLYRIAVAEALTTRRLFRACMGKPRNTGIHSGLHCCKEDVLALLQMAGAVVGIVAKLFLRIDGEFFVCGFACQRVKAETPHSQVWRAAGVLSLAPLARVAARCAWAPHGADMLVLSSGL